jgi:2-methylcitrate dehydratase PrpD
VTADLGTRYEAALNTYKPFACGIVTHPGIDAAIQLRNEFRLRPEQIQDISLRANPLVMSLTGKEHPQTGLEGKFSIYHCIAIALIDGAAGERQFSDHAVLDPLSVSLRQRVHVQLDAGLTTEQGDLSIRLSDGRTLHKRIEHAIGSLERPMTSQALETKFAALAEGILPPHRIRHVIDLCWRVARLEAAGDIARMSSST